MAGVTGSVGRSVQAGIYRAGALGRRPVVPVLPRRLELAAQRAMSRRAWAYVAGSAGQQRTARANLAAFGRYRLVPRMLRDVAVRDLGVELFGRRLPAPLLLAPVGVLELVHPDADSAVARAAAEVGLPMVVSTQASQPTEAIARAGGDGPRWFQLYWSRDRSLVTSLVRRAEAAGCEAIVVTLDTHLLGWRPFDLDQGFLPFAQGQGIAQYTSDPVFTALARRRASAGSAPLAGRPGAGAVRTLLTLARTHPGGTLANLRDPLPRAAVETFLDVFSNPSLTWDDLAYLREVTALPVLVKGVQHPADVELALRAGVDGIVVSNHGGRQVDGAVGALDALPGVLAAVAGRVPVLFDSGVRSGADAAIALALGARAVLVGRPYVYGLALDGTRGVVAVLEHLLAELDLTLGLIGCASIGELDRDLLAVPPAPDGAG
jgi:isopentenyl diphosphate isomerase/L-lactate dehydrogenase-like FMN-dependent dehydrogenase